MKINCPIAQQAEQAPDNIAVIAPGQTFTFSQFDMMVSRAVSLLEQKGIGRRTRVALVGRNSWEYIIILAALWRIGAIAVPLNFRFPPTRIDEILKRLGINYIIVHHDGSPSPGDHENFATKTPRHQEFFYNKPLGVPWCLGALVAIFIAEECVQYVQQDALLSDRKRIDLNNHAAIILTSGSTGREKGVLLTYGALYYNALGSNENIKLAPGDRWMLSLPLFHVGGLGVLFRSFMAGAAVVVPPENEKEALEDSLITCRVTHVSLVSTQLLRLINRLEEGIVTPGGFSHLKAVLLGGSGFPAALIQKALSLNLPIHTSYGLSEMASQVTTTPPGALGTSGAQAEKLFTSGKLLAHRDLFIDKNNEICVKGKTLFKGYVEGAEISRPLDNMGWFHTRDLGQVDAEGYLTVLGRRDNMFISGGENIMPEEIEAVLNELPEVERVVVVPVADEMYGFRPAAFLKLRESADTAAVTKDYLVRYLEGKLPRFKIPGFFYHWPEGLADGSLKVKRSIFEKLATKAQSHKATLRVL
ncbi:MAG: o-succinylbenzoate--CoA ligase [Candidatus Aminicenantes bacterium]|nr:o-succinylbenzoate--CoA ligase [Candidatus Aminicenantes bacterium]